MWMFYIVGRPETLRQTQLSVSSEHALYFPFGIYQCSKYHNHVYEHTYILDPLFAV